MTLKKLCCKNFLKGQETLLQESQNYAATPKIWLMDVLPSGLPFLHPWSFFPDHAHNPRILYRPSRCAEWPKSHALFCQ